MLIAPEWIWDYSKVSQTAPRKRTGLHLASYFGVVKAVDTLLRRKHIPDQMNSDGGTPMPRAAQSGNTAVTQLLLDTGAVGANSIDINGRRPLPWAAGNGHKIVFRYCRIQARLTSTLKIKMA